MPKVAYSFVLLYFDYLITGKHFQIIHQGISRGRRCSVRSNNKIVHFRRQIDLINFQFSEEDRKQMAYVRDHQTCMPIKRNNKQLWKAKKKFDNTVSQKLLNVQNICLEGREGLDAVQNSSITIQKLAELPQVYVRKIQVQSYDLHQNLIKLIQKTQCLSERIGRTLIQEKNRQILALTTILQKHKLINLLISSTSKNMHYQCSK